MQWPILKFTVLFLLKRVAMKVNSMKQYYLRIFSLPEKKSLITYKNTQTLNKGKFWSWLRNTLGFIITIFSTLWMWKAHFLPVLGKAESTAI